MRYVHNTSKGRNGKYQIPDDSMSLCEVTVQTGRQRAYKHHKFCHEARYTILSRVHRTGPSPAMLWSTASSRVSPSFSEPTSRGPYVRSIRCKGFMVFRVSSAFIICSLLMSAFCQVRNRMVLALTESKILSSPHFLQPRELDSVLRLPSPWFLLLLVSPFLEIPMIPISTCRARL